jgi:hypothetical protein
MKLLQLLGVVLLAGISFVAGSSYETSVTWTHAASAAVGAFAGMLALLVLVFAWPQLSGRGRPRATRPHRRAAAAGPRQYRLKPGATSW